MGHKGRGLLIVLTLLATTACSAKSDNAAPVPSSSPSVAAKPAWQPKAGTCHTGYSKLTDKATYAEVACTESHSYQTVHVGQFAGAAAEVKVPPAEDPAALIDCDVKVSEFLGGPWRERLVMVRVSVPLAADWTAGARWYLCELLAMGAMANGTTQVTVGLEGGFKTIPGLLNGCSDYSDGAQTAKLCTERHNTEFVGYIPSMLSHGAVLAVLNSEKNQLTDECYRLIDKFAGKTLNVSAWALPSSRQEWEAGDRNIRCFLYYGTTKVTKSLRAKV